VFRRHWREPGFWRWWWTNRAPGALRLGLGLFLLGAVLVGGLLTADRLSTAKGGTEVTAVLRTYVETVNKVVTVREKGKIVRKVVPVVHVRKVKVKVLSKPQTVLQTQTSFRTVAITTKGKVRTIRQKVVRRVPVVKTHLVTVSGKTQTVAVTQYKPTTAVETRSQTVTNAVTNSQTVTNSRTVTNTNTETDVVTTVQTKTQTVQNTVTETNVVTQTLPVTVEVTVPVTVTVTTTGP
jgi:hypothetical protein